MIHTKTPMPEALNEFVWYDPQQNEIVILPFNFSTLVMSALRGDDVPDEIVGIKITSKKPKFDEGRIEHKSGHVLEYVGDL